MRTRLAIAATLLTACSTWARSGSLVRDPCLHVGVRPGSDAVGDYALTVQVTTDWPARCAPAQDLTGGR